MQDTTVFEFECFFGAAESCFEIKGSYFAVRFRNDCAAKSMRVWEAWLRLAPARLTQSDRKNLGDFNAVLRLLIQSDGKGKPDGGIFAK